jgi:hypothetical protein
VSSFMNMYIVKKNCMVSLPSMLQCPNWNVFVKLPNTEFHENLRFFMSTNGHTGRHGEACGKLLLSTQQKLLY